MHFHIRSQKLDLTLIFCFVILEDVINKCVDWEYDTSPAWKLWFARDYYSTCLLALRPVIL